MPLTLLANRAHLQTRPGRSTGIGLIAVSPRGVAITVALCAAAFMLTGCKHHAKKPMATGAKTTLRPGQLTESQQERLDTAKSAKDTGNYDQALTLFQQILAENPT